MRLQILSIAVLGVALLAPSAVQAQRATTKHVTIVVRDQSGQGVAHAQVRLVPASDPSPATLETDARGQLSLNLMSGSYALFVSMSGFKNAALQIDVAAPSGKDNANQVVPVVLRVGDSFSPEMIYPIDSLVLVADAYHAPVMLSPVEFRALPHVTVIVRNGDMNFDESYSGVLLATLLALVNAPMGKKLSGEALRNYLVVSSFNGNFAAFSLAEVDPSLHRCRVLVADARNGAPLASAGPYELVVSGDKRPVRWISNLQAITLRAAR